MWKNGLHFILIFVFILSCKPNTTTLQRTLYIPEIVFDGVADTQQVSQLLDEHSKTYILNNVNWDAYPYHPSVKFKIAHSNNQIWLKYEVEEEYILAKSEETNGPVSKDSCVEFFFDPLGNGNYYNFEFNCIGTTLLAYGPQRKSRQYVPATLIENSVQIESSLGKMGFAEKSGGHKWEITIIIAADLLTHDQGIRLKGLRSRGNFYKCGDATSKKHYLSWVPISTEKPDFHRPEFFGELIFE